MFRNTRMYSMIATIFIVLAGSAQANASPDFQTIAHIYGSSSVKGKAVYTEKLIDGTNMQKFKVELQYAAPGKTYNVRVNGDLVGAITINSLGKGELQLRTAQFIDDPSDGDPIPDGFPQLDTGDVVTVGTSLVGAFYDSFDSTSQDYGLEDDFAGAGSAQGSVSYGEHFEDSALEREFEVEVEHAGANKNFTVKVRGKIVGTIHTNSIGKGKLKLRTPAFINSPNDGLPMASNFPTLQPGDVVKIGTMTATLATPAP